MRTFAPLPRPPVLVSVVVPVYNAAATVGEAIRSVLAQTHAAFELLLVDDGSADEGYAVCAGFADARIRIVRQENRGPAAARNAALRLARGHAVAFLDADDRWHPAKLARHVAHLAARPDVGLSVSRSRLVDAQGRSLRTIQGVAGPISAAMLLLDNPVGNGSAAVARREALAAVATSDGAVFDESLRGVEDVDLWLRIALQTPFQVEGVPEVLVDYRQQPTGLSGGGEQMRAGWERVLGKAAGYAPEVVGPLARPARARMLRYLAGRAVAARDGRAARGLLRAALAEDARLVRAQPRQVALTAAAALALAVAPPRLVDAAERFTRRLAAPPAAPPAVS